MLRDARDVAISMYHMFRNHLWVKYPGTMEDFFDIFLNDHIYYGPFHEHVNSFQQLKQCQHILFISYEQMVADPFATIKQISEFLNYNYTDQQLRQLTGHLSFENMRRNFIRPAIYSEDYKYNEEKKRFFWFEWICTPTKTSGLNYCLSSFFSFYRKGRSYAYHDEMNSDYIRKFDEWERTKTEIK